MLTINETYTILKRGQTEELEEAFQNPNTISSYEESRGQTLVGMLLLYPYEFPNRKNVFDTLMKYVNVRCIRGTNKSSIALACDIQDLEMTKWLLEAGVDANQDYDNYCPLNQVIFSQRSTLEDKKEFLNLLFRHGASLNVYYRNRPLSKHLLKHNGPKEKNALLLLEFCSPYFSEENKKIWKSIRLQRLFIKTNSI